MGLFDFLFKPPTRDKFAKQFEQALRRAGCTDAIEYVPDQFVLRVGVGNSKHIVGLQNFYGESLQLKRGERAEHVRNAALSIVRSKVDLPEEFEHAKPDLRVKVWSRATIELMRLNQVVEEGEAKLGMPLVEVGEHLYATVAYDLPTTVRSLDSGELEGWGVSIYEAMEVARHNLTEDGFAFMAIDERIYSAMTGDSYDSSRVMLVDLIRNLNVQGDHIAMIPNRDSLFVTGSDDDESLEMLLSLVEGTVDDPRPMLFTPLRLDGDAWVDWMPPETHPLFQRFRLLRVKDRYPEYERQKGLLEALRERGELVESFVATFNAVESEENGVFSYAVWSRTVDTLLPVVDRVLFFVDGQDVVADGPWDRVVEVCGDLMEETDYYPPRWRVRSFPSNEQLARLGQPS